MKLPRPGDRIRLISMDDDPDPVPFGTMGVVTAVDQHGAGRDAWAQIDVEWENGRALMLSVPPDRFEIADTE